MTQEEISALKEKEIAEINKYNDDNEYIDLFGCSGKLTINDFKLIKLIGKGSFGKVILKLQFLIRIYSFCVSSRTIIDFLLID